MPKLVLKIDVDTLRGTLEGVPRLLSALAAVNAPATFLFSLGPDHTGRAIKRVFRPGFFAKVQRTSVVSHYGIKTLLYGTVLPGPDIGKRGQQVLRQVAQAGHECGIHCWDHFTWQDYVRHKPAAWTDKHLRKAFERFQAIFGYAAPTHGAAGWQMNDHALSQHSANGLRYASDSRGTHPFWPVVNGKTLAHIEMPTTLPTLDELLGREVNGTVIDESNVAQHLLRYTAAQQQDHVFTLHAELEGMKLLPVFAELLRGWQAQGYELSTMSQYFHVLQTQNLPKHAVTWGEVAGRTGDVLLQGAPIV
ncbi:polysaccharide deacetylase family protein [Parvibium lacunae]|uniref:4-deoxy-4-formamido-L-arabinose-phosphoundecaprenol deformylase n=1 Tax=Parvibium lacunae TaxID=1888893 RepID=A0A368L6Z5_9BURK|nr:polysaccharide deacetylase family protein [Parvibium lacunae]RCS59384.1 4-deoxy-4-formamido-L-arabinose-phosphoundecaprenol deformylase [Parvibium lacunae]